MSLTLVAGLSRDDARALTEEVKADSQELWLKMLRLYEGRAHTALDYLSWGAYYEAEFGESAGRGYQLLRSAEVIRTLEAECTSVHRPATERVARELAPLRDDPEELAEAWNTAVERHGPTPTPAEVREVVRGPFGDPDHDTRWTRLENVQNSLQNMPAPEKIVWPREPGDVDAVDGSFRFLLSWLPRAWKSWRVHKAAMKAEAKVARKQHNEGLRAVA